MDIPSSIIAIAFAGLIHASFQLSVSILTLLSGHAIGAKTAHKRLLRLMGGFLTGAAIMTLLLVSLITLCLQLLFQGAAIPPLVWAAACGLLVSLGVAVWIFYYRREPGTSLWLPRDLARFLMNRTKATRSSAEAFSLGMSSVMVELLFIIGPMLMAGLILVGLEPAWQLVGLCLYAAASLLSLALVAALIGGGHSLGRIQRWRETNKGFLQFIAGSGLIVLGFYMYVNQVGSSMIAGRGGF
jgi:hypothetical protein